MLSLYHVIMSDEWENQMGEDGITLGPEEALQREIQKSKSLKVERLQLRGQVEKLQAEVRDLTEKVRQQELEKAQNERLASPAETSSKQSAAAVSGLVGKGQLSRGWAFFILIFNISAIGLLLYFQLQK